MLVRSKQEYAMTNFADMGKGATKDMDIAKAAILRRFVGVPPNTSKYEIFALAGVMPPYFRAKLLTAKESFKVKTFNSEFYEDLVKTEAETSYTTTLRDFNYLFNNTNICYGFKKIKVSKKL